MITVATAMERIISMQFHSSSFGIVPLTITLLLFSGCLGTAGKGSAPQGKLPDIKKDCAICHPSHGGEVTGVLIKPVSDLCLSCHPDRTGEREHAVDVVPSMTVTGLPLREGRVACTTCHDPHNNRYGNMLRMPPQKLCQACHRK